MTKANKNILVCMLGFLCIGNVLAVTDMSFKTLENKEKRRFLSMTPVYLNGVPHVAFGSKHGVIKIVDLNGNCVKEWSANDDFIIESLITLYDEKDTPTIVAGFDDGTLQIFDLNGNCINGIDGYENEVLSLALLKNKENGKSSILFTSEDATIKMWDGGECIESLNKHEAKCVSMVVVYGKDETPYVASGSADKKIIIRNMKNQCEMTLEGYNGIRKCLNALYDKKSDKTYIVFGADNSKINVFNLEGTCVASWNMYDNGMIKNNKVSALAVLYSKNDTPYIISGSFDATITVYDAHGKCIKVLTGHTGSIFAIDVVYNTDRQAYIVSVGYDKAIKFWKTDFLPNN